MTPSPGFTLMLYDGECGLCAASVQFILRHEREHTLQFAALQSTLGETVRARHPELRGVDSMVWVEHAGDAARERVSVRASAVMHAAWYVGGLWRFAILGRVLPGALRDRMYDLVARHRHRLVQSGQCYLPPPHVRRRFLD